MSPVLDEVAKLLAAVVVGWLARSAWSRWRRHGKRRRRSGVY